MSGGQFKALIAQFGNGSRDNVGFTLNAGESMTLNFKDNATDTNSLKHFNLTSFAKKVSVANNKLATLTKINGKELKSPITLGTDSSNVWSSGIEWLSVVVEADENNTVFEIYAS